MGDPGAVRATEGHGKGTGSALPLLVVSCLLFAYVAVRAWVVPITWDEAYSYLEFTRKGRLSPFEFPSLAANNHFLNTWLTYLTTGLLGVSELTLRLPALTGHLLYLYYTARLCGEWWSSPPLRVSGFVILNLNPYLLDFFSLSRGYGLAYGLLAGSLWYLYRFFRTNLQARYATASVALAILAVLAHLTLLLFLVALVSVIVAAAIGFAPAGLTLPRRIAHGLRRTMLPVALVGAFLAPTAVVVKGLRSAGAFYYGGASFWSDTIVTLFNGSLYERRYLPALDRALPGSSVGLSQLLGGLAVVVVLLAAWVSARSVIRQRDARELFLPALVLLLTAGWLASVGQHHLLGVPYLTRRTALYLLVLLAFLFVALAAKLGQGNKAWRYGLPVVAACMVLHFLNCFNLQYVVEWKLAADVKEMVRDLARARSEPLPGKINTTVGLNLEFEAPINYYRLVDHLGWLNVASRKTKYHPLNDFFLYSDADWQTVSPDSFVVMKTYPLTHSRLVRRRVPPSRYEVRFDKTVDFDAPGDSLAVPGRTTTRAAYSGTRSGMTGERSRRSGGITAALDVAALPAQQSMVAVTAMVWMQSLRNANALLVVQFSRGRRAYASHYLTVQDGALQARSWFPVSLTCFVPEEARQGDLVSVFFWNDRETVYVDDVRMQWTVARY